MPAKDADRVLRSNSENVGYLYVDDVVGELFSGDSRE
jgi:hypothetical protein